MRLEEDIPDLGERIAFAMAALAQVVLRTLYVLNHRADFDEPQHLHVVWGWTQGLVQYRDYFDNHTPIFQMLSAPILKLFGERADILIPMRLAMIPLFGGMLWCTYRMGRALYSSRAGIWAAIFAALYPVFMLTSTEFRTDDLWVLGWMVTLTVAVNAPLT